MVEGCQLQDVLWFAIFVIYSIVYMSYSKYCDQVQKFSVQVGYLFVYLGGFSLFFMFVEQVEMNILFFQNKLLILFVKDIYGYGRKKLENIEKCIEGNYYLEMIFKSIVMYFFL